MGNYAASYSFLYYLHLFFVEFDFQLLPHLLQKNYEDKVSV